MTQYFTRTTQVNLRPGEKLGFTTGKGYYAIPAAPPKAAAPVPQQPPVALPPASTPSAGPARTPAAATPTPASAGIPPKPAVARQPATLAATQPTAATTAPPPAAQPERRATEHPIQPSPVTRAYPVVANHPRSHTTITKAHATSEIAKLTTTHGTITNITIHPAAEQRDKHRTLELLATMASAAARSGSFRLTFEVAAGVGYGPGRSRTSVGVGRTRGTPAIAAIGSDFVSDAASGGGYSTRPDSAGTHASGSTTPPTGATRGADQTPQGAGAPLLGVSATPIRPGMSSSGAQPATSTAPTRRLANLDPRVARDREWSTAIRHFVFEGVQFEGSVPNRKGFVEDKPIGMLRTAAISTNLIGRIEQLKDGRTVVEVTLGTFDSRAVPDEGKIPYGLFVGVTDVSQGGRTHWEKLDGGTIDPGVITQVTSHEQYFTVRPGQRIVGFQARFGVAIDHSPLYPLGATLTVTVGR